MAFYLTSRGITNEVYYAAQKTARFLGTNHVDNSARLCHAASTSAMKAMLGHGASSCSYVDWLGADLIVFFGSNTPNNQPVTTKYLYYAKQQRRADRRRQPVSASRDSSGTGCRRSWRAPRSARGSPITGSTCTRAAISRFSLACSRRSSRADAVDEAFIREYTTGGRLAREAAAGSAWPALEAESGATEARMRAFARLLVERPNDGVRLVDGAHPARARREHDQGADERRARARAVRTRAPRRHADPRPFRRAGRRRGRLRAHRRRRHARTVGTRVGLPGSARTRVHGDRDGRCVGVGRDRSRSGSSAAISSRRLPRAAHVRRALERPRLRIHQDIVCSSAMLVEPSDTVLAAARRRPATSRPVAGPRRRPNGASSFRRRFPAGGSARRGPSGGRSPKRRRGPAPSAPRCIRFADAAAIRAEIARAIPLYAGIETLAAKGDQVQWGGRLLYEHGQFATPDRQGALRGRSSPRGRTPRAGRVLRLDAAGQAVQLDDPEVESIR